MESIHKKQSNNIILITGVLVFFACLVICILHIIDIRTSLEGEIQKQFETQIRVAQNHLSARFDEDIRLTDLIAEELSPYTGGNFVTDEVVGALKKYKAISDFDRIIFVDTYGFVLADDGSKSELTEKCEEEVNIISEKSIYVSDEEELFYGENTILTVTPVYKNGIRTGTVIGENKASNMLNDSALDYLIAAGDVMIVDGDGVILDCSFVNLKDQTEHYDTVFDCMKDYWHLDEISIAKVENLIDDSIFQSNTIECRNRAGNRYFYTAVQASDYAEICMLVMYTDEIFAEIHDNILYGSIITSTLIMGMMALFSFIAYRYSANAGKMIRKLAYEDEITGGKNINYFKEFTNETLKKFANIPFVICRFDVANFRYINEAYGHVRADSLLKIIDEEAGNIFKGRECCVRMTADQFVVLAKGGDDLNSRFLIFTDKVNARALDIGIRYPIKFKRGMYNILKKENNISLMIDRANVARKTLTGDEAESVAYYNDDIVADMKKVDRIESEMEMAMFNGEFKMFIQPKWDIVKDRIYGGEALVRWIKDDSTMVYPSDFVPVFEKNGFVERLDMFMLESACILINGLMMEKKPIYPISVNQSRVLMHSPDYIERVTELLNRYHIPEGYIELEVTETVLFAESEKMIGILKELKRRQIALSMDDFGSGYSSLNMLKDYPFDVLKIDKEFFSESIASRTSVWILKKIIEMADGLGLRVICEGVETADQVEMLRKIGCRYVQGYFYSKPIPAEDFVDKYCEGNIHEYVEELERENELEGEAGATDEAGAGDAGSGSEGEADAGKAEGESPAADAANDAGKAEAAEAGKTEEAGKDAGEEKTEPAGASQS
ncbi:MAG TPA: hypothetical protein DCG85_01965 [Lachnospiraceae bacterium]|nr:hypothetical protein [Lachnospiraceae bacterium]